MVAWWATLLIVLTTLTICVVLILVARSIKASQESARIIKKKNKRIQVHESRSLLRRATVICRTANSSAQEERSIRKNSVCVATDIHPTPVSKVQLGQFPWWSYMFVVVGGFMVCMFLNYVANRVNAARFKRYEELHANDPDTKSEQAQELLMKIECPKKAQNEAHSGVREITLVFTQDENQRRSKEEKCDNVLVKPTTSGVTSLNATDTEPIDQTIIPYKPIQIKDSILTTSTTVNILERESISQDVKTEPVYVDVESEQVDIVEMKRCLGGKMKLCASVPIIRLFEMVNDQITGIKQYASDVSLSPYRADKAENKYG